MLAVMTGCGSGDLTGDWLIYTDGSCQLFLSIAQVEDTFAGVVDWDQSGCGEEAAFADDPIFSFIGLGEGRALGHVGPVSDGARPVTIRFGADPTSGAALFVLDLVGTWDAQGISGSIVQESGDSVGTFRMEWVRSRTDYRIESS